MKFQPKAERGAVKIRLIPGSLCRFDGKTLSVAYGDPSTPLRASKGRLTRRKFVLAMRKVIALAKQNKIKSISINFKDIKALAPKNFSDNDVGKATATAFVMAGYEHTTYKTKPKEGFSTVEVVAITDMPEPAKAGGFWVGEQIGAEVNACRELSNTPGGDMTPPLLVKAAKAAARTVGAGPKVTVKSLGLKELTRLGAGAIVGVGKGAKD